MCLREREWPVQGKYFSHLHRFLLNLVLISSWSLINPRKRWTHRPIDFPFLINTKLPKANLKLHTGICTYVKTHIRYIQEPEWESKSTPP